VHIPGFNGYLSSRFFLREDLWRHRVLWPNQEPVSAVSISYVDSSNANVELINKDGSWSISGQPADGMKVQALLKAIASSQYEGAIIPSDGVYRKQDSLKPCPHGFKSKFDAPTEASIPCCSTTFLETPKPSPTTVYPKRLTPTVFTRFWTTAEWCSFSALVFNTC
jgi:hypothetical protein